MTSLSWNRPRECRRAWFIAWTPVNAPSWDYPAQASRVFLFFLFFLVARYRLSKEERAHPAITPFLTPKVYSCSCAFTESYFLNNARTPMPKNLYFVQSSFLQAWRQAFIRGSSIRTLLSDMWYELDAAVMPSDFLVQRAFFMRFRKKNFFIRAP